MPRIKLRHRVEQVFRPASPPMPAGPRQRRGHLLRRTAPSATGRGAVHHEAQRINRAARCRGRKPKRNVGVALRDELAPEQPVKLVRRVVGRQFRHHTPTPATPVRRRDQSGLVDRQAKPVHPAGRTIDASRAPRRAVRHNGRSQASRSASLGRIAGWRNRSGIIAQTATNPTGMIRIGLSPCTRRRTGIRNGATHPRDMPGRQPGTRHRTRPPADDDPTGTRPQPGLRPEQTPRILRSDHPAFSSENIPAGGGAKRAGAQATQKARAARRSFRSASEQGDQARKWRTSRDWVSSDRRILAKAAASSWRTRSFDKPSSSPSDSSVRPSSFSLRSATI